MNINTQLKYYVLFSFFFISCIGENEKKIELTITNNEERNQKIDKIRNNIYNYIVDNSSSSIIGAYFYILDNKEKSIKFFDENLYIGFDKDSIKVGINDRIIRISPLPMSYELVKGKKADYNIKDKENRILKSFILNFHLDKDMDVKNCWLLLFYEGNNKKSVKSEIDISTFFDYKNQLLFIDEAPARRSQKQ